LVFLETNKYIQVLGDFSDRFGWYNRSAIVGKKCFRFRRYLSGSYNQI